jgi:8-oxo-dGTP diphosphatase
MKTAAIAVIKQNDRYLTVSRRHDPFDMGFPGGKIEDGETLIDGLCREVKEEVDIEVMSLRLLMVRDGFDHEVHVFLIDNWIGEPKSYEGTRVAWLTEDQLIQQKSFGKFNENVLQKLKMNESPSSLC